MVEPEPLRWFLVRATDRIGYLVRVKDGRYLLHFQHGDEAEFEAEEIVQVFTC